VRDDILRKLWITLFILLIIAGQVFISYFNKYSIADNKAQLTDSILQSINRPDAVTDKIEIKQELNLDNKKYILFPLKDELGYAELTQGISKKYRFETVGHGSNFFRDVIKQTNKGKYLVFLGKNPESKIHYIKVILDGTEYKIDVPNQEYYIVYHQVPMKTQRTYPDIENIKFFSNDDIDITKDMLHILL
jgi:hypothetical protein